MAKTWLFPLIFISLNSMGDGIVAGKTVMGCAEDGIQVETPTAPEYLPNNNPIPSQCTDFSGTWEGGCYDAVPTNWPTLNGHVVLAPLGTDSPVTASPTGDLNQNPTTVDPVFRITQNGCSSLSIQSNNRNQENDLTKRVEIRQRERFTRTCDSDGAKWRRTYDFSFSNLSTPLWRENGTLFRRNVDVDGLDRNYHARYRYTANHDFQMWNGKLRLARTVYVRASRWDPPAFEFSVPNVAARICLYRKR